MTRLLSFVHWYQIHFETGVDSPWYVCACRYWKQYVCSNLNGMNEELCLCQSLNKINPVIASPWLPWVQWSMSPIPTYLATVIIEWVLGCQRGREEEGKKCEGTREREIESAELFKCYSRVSSCYADVVPCVSWITITGNALAFFSLERERAFWYVDRPFVEALGLWSIARFVSCSLLCATTD